MLISVSPLPNKAMGSQATLLCLRAKKPPGLSGVVPGPQLGLQGHLDDSVGGGDLPEHGGGGGGEGAVRGGVARLPGLLHRGEVDAGGEDAGAVHGGGEAGVENLGALEAALLTAGGGGGGVEPGVGAGESHLYGCSRQ